MRNINEILARIRAFIHFRDLNPDKSHTSPEAADAIALADEIERLRGLLTECGNFIVLGADEGCEPGACAECDMHRLRLRIDAALAGAAVQPSVVPRCKRCGDTGWLPGDPILGISEELCGCDENWEE